MSDPIAPLRDLLNRLYDVARSEDTDGRRRRAASLLLQIEAPLYTEASATAQRLGLLDEAALRRIAFVRAQALPEAEWRYRAFLLLDRPSPPTTAPIERDGDEPDGATYQEP